MRKLYYLFLFLMFFTSFINISAQIPKGGPSSEAVAPTEINPMLLPAPEFFNKPPEIAEEEEDYPDKEKIEKLRNIDLPVIPNDKSIILLKTQDQINEAIKKGENPQAHLIYEWNRGQGPVENGSIPPDPNLAVGPFNVVVTVNKLVNIYNSRDFSLISSSSLSNWFYWPGANLFDPKVIYDPWGMRWVVVALQRSSTESYYCVAVSQSADAAGRWWIYRLRADVDGSNSTNYWADYPGLGFSYPIGGTGNAGCIAITSNQYDHGTPNRYKYAKLRLLKTSELYVGAPVHWYDFWDLGFTMQPARQLSSTASSNLYLLRTDPGGSNRLHLYRIDNPTSSNPSFHDQASIGVTSYSVLPPAAQRGGIGLLDAFTCKTQDVWMLADHVFTAWTSAYNYGSGNRAIVHYARVNVATNSLVQEMRLGIEGEWLMQPSACPHFTPPFNHGYAALSFTRTSSSIYPQACILGYDASAPSQIISISSTGYYNQSTTICDTVRWGDYAGVAPDPAQNGLFWSISETANPGQWTTGVFRFGFTQKPTLVVNSPNGGETWYIGSSRVITWTQTGLTNVKAEYTTNNGSTWSVITPSTPAATGFVSWTVPNTPSTQCKVRVSDANVTDVSDESNAVFTITQAPSLTVLSPNGGEIWHPGETRNIRWNSVNVGNVRIDYTTNGGMWWMPVTSSVAASDLNPYGRTQKK